MTVRELQKLVQQGEGLKLEFKRKVMHPDKIVREIVALANTKGGDLLIGVNDDGNLSGLKYPEEEAFTLEKAMNTLCKPKISFDKEVIRLTDKKAILRYHIHESRKKPHGLVLNPQGGRNIKPSQRTRERLKTYVRVFDRSIQASHEMRMILQLEHRIGNVQFTWTDTTRKLFTYLEENQHITKKDFMRLAQISSDEAAELLITLVLARVIMIKPREKGDYYALRPEALEAAKPHEA